MGRGGPILLAEDEETDVFLLRMALRKAGITADLIVARNGLEVIDYLSQITEEHPCPSILLLDLKMPRMNGFEVLSWLQEKHSLVDLPVVVFSSSTHESDTVTARQLGAREYLVKPHDLHELSTVLKSLLTRYLP